MVVRMSIDKFDLIKETFKGSGFADIPPVSVWKHFPNDDRSPEGLAEKELEFQRLFDPDLKKISFHGRYSCVDFGCKVYYDGSLSGSTRCKEHAIQTIDDWENLEPVDVNDGEFGKQLKAVDLISRELEDVVPMMVTVFSPMMVADKLTKNLLLQLRDAPQLLREALEILQKVMTEFSKACLEAGAHGIFFASQHVSRGDPRKSLTEEEFNRFCQLPDTTLLRTIRPRADFLVMHLHGRDIRFKKVVETYPIDAVNWHDQQTFPSLIEARELFPGTLLGGIDEMDTLRKFPTNKIEEDIHQTIGQFGPGKLIIAPGCVIPQDVSNQRIEATINAVRNFHPATR